MKSQVAPLSALRRPGERLRPTSMVNGPTRRPQARIRIVIVDDHPIALAGLEALLSGERDLGVVARCVDGYDAVRAVAAHQPDVLVVDQDMPVMDGVALLKHLRTSGDQTPLVLLATTNNQKVAEALSLDVQGIVFKHSDPRQLVRCLVGLQSRQLPRRGGRRTGPGQPDPAADRSGAGGRQRSQQQGARPEARRL
jgi:CheY-like chemotaxis protein